MYEFFEKKTSYGYPCLYVRYPHQPENSNKCKRILMATSHGLIIVNGNSKFFNKASSNSKIKLLCFLLENGYCTCDYFKKLY